MFMCVSLTTIFIALEQKKRSLELQASLTVYFGTPWKVDLQYKIPLVSLKSLARIIVSLLKSHKQKNKKKQITNNNNKFGWIPPLRER